MSERGARHATFQAFNVDVQHQHLAGVASWAAFSARWRARQGLPLLHPMDVQYLTPQDFRNGCGHPLPASEQRRLFRQYVAAALRLSHGEETQVPARRPLVHSGDLAFVRAEGFVRSMQLRPNMVYGGREDVLPYESEALLPTRPYGIPVTSPTFEGYWIQGDDLAGDEEW